MYRQIPRYYNEIITQENGVVDAIVYIPKNPYKSPDRTGWNEDEIKQIKERLHIIPAHLPGKINLVDNWILPCANITKNEDAKSILRQYASLIKSLTPQIMSDNNTQELINYIADNKVEEIITLRQIIDEVPAQMATNLREKLKADEECNKKLDNCIFWSGQPNTCVVDIKGQTIQIYIYTYLDKNEAYVLSIRDWKNQEQKLDWLVQCTEVYEFGIKLREDQKSYFCTFEFTQEDDVIRCVKEIIKALPN